MENIQRIAAISLIHTLVIYTAMAWDADELEEFLNS